MTNLDEFGFRRAQGFALEQAITIQTVSGDLRWALATLAVRSFIAMWALGRARLAALVRHAAHGNRQKPRFMTPSRCC
jgi:hypothetical protein